MARKGGRSDKNSGKGKRGSVGQNRAAGDEYLTKNAQKESVFVTDSGLQFEDLTIGDGPAPRETDIVRLDQRAWLVNGTVIEDTFQVGRPDTCALSECIEGYREGLLMMRCGGKARLTVPPHLAWGKKGVGSKIGPESVVIFDVWLREII